MRWKNIEWVENIYAGENSGEGINLSIIVTEFLVI